MGRGLYAVRIQGEEVQAGSPSAQLRIARELRKALRFSGKPGLARAAAKARRELRERRKGKILTQKRTAAIGSRWWNPPKQVKRGWRGTRFGRALVAVATLHYGRSLVITPAGGRVSVCHGGARRAAQVGDLLLVLSGGGAQFPPSYRASARRLSKEKRRALVGALLVDRLEPPSQFQRGPPASDRLHRRPRRGERARWVIKGEKWMRREKGPGFPPGVIHSSRGAQDLEPPVLEGGVPRPT